MKEAYLADGVVTKGKCLEKTGFSCFDYELKEQGSCDASMADLPLVTEPRPNPTSLFMICFVGEYRREATETMGAKTPMGWG